MLVVLTIQMQWYAECHEMYISSIEAAMLQVQIMTMDLEQLLSHTVPTICLSCISDSSQIIVSGAWILPSEWAEGAHLSVPFITINTRTLVFCISMSFIFQTSVHMLHLSLHLQPPSWAGEASVHTNGKIDTHKIQAVSAIASLHAPRAPPGIVPTCGLAVVIKPFQVDMLINNYKFESKRILSQPYNNTYRLFSSILSDSFSSYNLPYRASLV